MWVCFLFNIITYYSFLFLNYGKTWNLKLLRQLWKQWTNKRASASQDRQPTTNPRRVFYAKSTAKLSRVWPISRRVLTQSYQHDSRYRVRFFTSLVQKKKKQKADRRYHSTEKHSMKIWREKYLYVENFAKFASQKPI